MSSAKSPRRKPEFPASLTDLHRLGKTVHGHDGSSRIVMVRKTDQRTFASIRNGEEPKLETITRETIETFRGQRTECKITTEKKDCDDQLPAELIDILNQQVKRNTKAKSTIIKKRSPIMEFQSECLKAHNEFRQQHGVAPLKLNKEMCKLSQQWANTLIKRNTLEHSSNRDFGENIFCVSSSNTNFSINGDDPVKSWYEEIKVHQFGTEPKSLASGHFSQVVWKETKELGVAFAKNGGKVVVVAYYSPPGNVIGRFAENVPPLGGFDAENNNDVTTRLSQLNLASSQKNLSSGTEGDFDNDFLQAHNEHRILHGVPPLKLDRKLCKYSEEWARILASKNKLEHRRNSPYGENIYCMYSSDPNFAITGHTPVDTWYEEIKQHPFGREPHNLKSGHFTQVIWKTSELLGVGVAKSRQGYIYVVANYSPAGNFLGHFAENVPPLVTSSSNSQTANGSANGRHESEERNRSVSPDEEDFDQFAVEALKVHNEYRKKHGVAELKLSKKLCDYAKEWAEQCSKTGNMAHRPNNSYGENIFSMYSSDFSHIPSARDAVRKWYDEIRDHTFGTESVNYNSLHFSQVIWKSSYELGIGMAKNNKGQTYVVANYSPRGNIVGQFSANVPKPKS